ncbi:MAG: hypothetical protein R3C40_10695 [Parvularculaceae bacterium]
MVKHAIIFAAVFLAASCARIAAQDTVTIHPDKTYQTIDGWEFTTRVWEMDKPNNAYSGEWLNRRDQIVDGLVNQIGFNRIRMEVRSGFENPVDYWSQFVAGDITYEEVKSHFYEKINDNDDPNVLNEDGIQWSCLDYYVENLLIPMRAKLEERGERLHIVLNYVDFKRPPLASDLSHSKNPEEFAELIAAAFDHLKSKYDITPDAFEVILEPDNTLDWTGERIAAGLVAVDERLSQQGVRPQYIAPSTAHASRAPKYFDEIARNRQALDLLDVISYHRYDWKRASAAIPKIVSRARAYDLDTAMLEFVQGKPWQLVEDLTQGQVVAWQKYGVPYRPIPPGEPELQPIPHILALAQVFTNVRRGAVRIGAGSSSKQTRPMAFRNKDGSYAIFVYRDAPGDVVFANVPAGSYVLTMANAEKVVNLGPQEVQTGEEFAISLPSPGLLTLRQRFPG